MIKKSRTRRRLRTSAKKSKQAELKEVASFRALLIVPLIVFGFVSVALAFLFSIPSEVMRLINSISDSPGSCSKPECNIVRDLCDDGNDKKPWLACHPRMKREIFKVRFIILWINTVSLVSAVVCVWV